MKIETVTVRYRGKDIRAKRLNLDAEVNRGAKLLDRVVPGWHKRITQSTLRLESPSVCVLGQLATTKLFREALGNTGELGYEDDDYFEARKALAAAGYLPDVYLDHRYGFSYDENALWDKAVKANVVDTAEDDHYSLEKKLDVWDVLTKTWIAAIKARRQADRNQKKVNA